ncbi:Importin alpha subunit (Karyopherin alpha subunit) (Serine-rich RNA polymerase I suppressor protein) [Phytophthora boehmeriae]|uniref:Importin alpha subunit (Karyopherin alpha subunit) (Serine-rich RNA polymerase I suppressor protein) n=1 Tax=Phytophthora boehmeriae TaxID=109152 RepID=A0A8T1WT76_9STRA|nr:Importin alpha subunit (Karyopherin alpha subunit) (Serine-rich RNA polymerase I suppressor protein) [Phytophthora boehmeriae]
MSGSFKSSSSSQKAFLSPTDVAELTAAAVAALPSSLSQASLALQKASSSAHRTENGDIVHHHQATHRGGNATLVTSTTTTIHHMGKGGVSAPVGGNGTQPQFSLHSHGHHHHHHLSHGASLLANGSLSGLANGSLGTAGLDGNMGSQLEASPTFQGDLNQIDAGLNSEDADVQLEAAKKLRVLLSSERDLLIRQMLEKNWTPRLIKWLRLRDRPTLQVEALWALTNIAAGATDNTSVLLQNGVIPTLVSLLDSSNEEVLEQSVWVLGNLAGEEGLERILQVGELEAKRTDAPNPYASLMASANIETLVSHKSATVAKRASRIWQQHFVTCAICMGPFSKHSNDTFFCAECKCNVCKNCDCTVFHLKYQESLWKEETEKETSEKQARQASKRSKRQKKRQRTKERKAALARGQKSAPSSGKGSKHNQQQKGQQDDNSSSDDGSSTRSGGGGRRRSSRRQDADDSASDNGTNEEDEEEEGATTPGDEEEVAPAEEVNFEALDEMVNANDKLVSYLLETGSIMALAERLDLEDDSMWIVAEKDRTAIHA